TVLAPSALPKAGSSYAQQRGKVLECLRPVSMTLQETLFDPPCCVKLRLHWRLEPVETGSFVLLDARYSLNGAASLRRRHWGERIHAHCARMLGSVQSRLDALPVDPREPLARTENRTSTIQTLKHNGKRYLQ
ncbi:MAG TPA: hypothetical protein VJA26_12790, partial [Gammaproteobacteria bacterium]|nr:hypothetical protein [Gammaproteobacteria bacterium]